MITYEMLINDELIDGVFAMSLVDSPAIQSDYILLSKDDRSFIELKLEKLADKKRHIVSGAALIPNIVIPRNDKDGPYNITFSEETIRKISENFLIQGNKDNVTLQHQVSVNNVFLVESWIVEDPENDKSKTLGLDVPKGTWMISMKIKDEELWNEYIESGVLKGFSLEGNFSKREVHMHNEWCKHPFTDEEREIYDLYLAVNFRPQDLDSRYAWRLSKADEACPSCIDFDGQVKTLRQWINTAIPATPNGTMIAGLSTTFPYSPYGTFCEQNCRCQLVKVQDVVKKAIKSPFAKWKK